MKLFDAGLLSGCCRGRGILLGISLITLSVFSEVLTFLPILKFETSNLFSSLKMRDVVDQQISIKSIMSLVSTYFNAPDLKPKIELLSLLLSEEKRRKTKNRKEFKIVLQASS